MTSILNKLFDNNNDDLFPFLVFYVIAMIFCIWAQQWTLFAFLFSIGAFVYIEDKMHYILSIRQDGKNRELENNKILLQIRDKELKALEIQINSRQ